MAESAVSPKGRILWPNLVTVVSAGILFGAETVGLGLALGWAVASWFGLGDTGTLVFEAAFIGLGLLAALWFVRRGFEIEPWRA